MNLQEAFDTSFEAVKVYVDRVQDALEARLAVMERRLDALPTAKDGVGIKGFLKDYEGNVVVTLSDGSAHTVAVFDGKDGADGKDGRDGVDGRDGKDGESIKGEAGKDGRDGADGLGFEDIEEELADDGRTIVRRYRRGELVKEFRHSMAVVLDRGVYKAGQEYEPGDAVTFGGSLWIAQAKTTEKPEGGDAWRLAVKKGRDGKDIAR